VEVIMKRCACLIFALALAMPALAEIPYPDLCSLSNPEGTDGAVVFTLPNGMGNALDNARLGGAVVNATLTLTVVNNQGDPVAAYPAADMWMISAAGGLVTCDLVHPEGPTDGNGQTTFLSPVAGGGNSLMEDAQAVIEGDLVPTTAPVHFVSADISGDLSVNLSDITLFTQDLNGTYDARSDFNADGAINLSDITLMTQGIGAVCP
jgi:hypothetical protein